MKEKIKAHLGDRVIITYLDSKPNVVTLWSTASAILHDFYSQPKKLDPTEEKMRMIRATAKLLKSDIKCIQQDVSNYPDVLEVSSSEVTYSFLPESL